MASILGVNQTQSYATSSFCAVIGMFLATPGMVPYSVLIGGIVGIWLLAGAAFAVNCLIEQVVDAKMRRTAWRPSATGELSPYQIIVFSILLGALGMVVLWNFTNPLTMWLTVATFVGYAVIYTWLLKPATPKISSSAVYREQCRQRLVGLL